MTWRVFYLLVYILARTTYSLTAWKLEGRQPLQEETCAYQAFTGVCNTSEVLYVQSAVYGHKESEKCGIDQSHLYPEGCSNDILHLVEDACTGRNTCIYPAEGSVPNDEMIHADAHCSNFPEHQRYKLTMLVNYHCVEDGIYDKCLLTRTDTDGNKSVISPRSEAVISGRCGTIRSPVLIRAQPGQRIQLELLDLKADERNDSSNICEKYVTVMEDNTGTSGTPVCGTQIRLRIAYNSSGSQISLVFDTKGDNAKYILQHNVIGCPTMTPPKRGRVRSESFTKAAVICDHGDKKYEVTCENNQWRGAENVECPEGTAEMNVIVIAASAAGGVVVLVIVVVIGVVCVQKHKHNDIANAHANITGENSTNPDIVPTDPRQGTKVSQDSPYSVATDDLSKPPGTVQMAPYDHYPAVQKQVYYHDADIEILDLPLAGTSPLDALYRPDNRTSTYGDTLPLPEYPDEQ